MDKALFKIAKVIQSLPPEAKALWGRCSLRRLDIGIQAGVQPHSAQFTISQEVVTLLHAVQVEIGMTVYAPADGGMEGANP